MFKLARSSFNFCAETRICFKLNPTRPFQGLYSSQAITEQGEGSEQLTPNILPIEPLEAASKEKVSITSNVTKLEASLKKPDKLFKKVELEILSYELATLDSYQWYVLTAATHLGIKVEKVWSPPRYNRHLWNLLKAIHVHKKHQYHYEVRNYHRFISLRNMTGSTVDTFLEYIERNLPEGIGLKVTKVEVQPLPQHLKEQPS